MIDLQFKYSNFKLAFYFAGIYANVPGLSKVGDFPIVRPELMLIYN
jgi:hypothetical protein